MPWYGWLLVAYLAVDAGLTVLWVGRSIEITPRVALLTVLTHIGLIAAAVALAGLA